ncbi:MAG: rod shape-determining protein [bacterium]
MLNKLLSLLSHDIGIDLGTANTLVYVRKKGIVINEPSVVAINQKTGKVLAIGENAKKMVGKTPGYITAIRPLVDGVISDFEITEQMLRYFIDKVQSAKFFSFLSRPRIVIGIPSGVTEVEKKAVQDAAMSAGAREVYLIEEPMAAAIGSRLPIQEATGNMIIDIGGGTTDIAVISLGGIVVSKSLRIAGDEMNESIIQFVREQFNILLGERTAEAVKINIGSACELPEPMEMQIRGRDIVTGLPREATITDEQARMALKKTVKVIISNAKAAIEETPPELVADIMHRGIVLTGGGSLLKGLDKAIAEETKMPIKITEDPLTSVVRGAGIILEDLDSLREVLASAV